MNPHRRHFWNSVSFAPEGEGGTSADGGSGAPAAPAPSSAPSSSPAPTPSAPASPSPSSEPSGASSPAPGSPPEPISDFDFNTLLGGEFSQDAPGDLLAQPVGQPPAEPAPAPVVPPAPAAPAPAPAPQAPEAQPAPTPAAAPGPDAGAQPARLDAADPQSVARFFETDAMIASELEKSFQLSPEDREAMETDFVGALPKFAAKATQKAVASTLNLMSAVVPRMIAAHMARHESSTSAETAFYGKYPGFNKAAHGAKIRELARTYRMANPGVPMEQAMDELAAWAGAVLKVSPAGAAPAAPGQPPAPPAPGLTPTGRPIQTMPFAPAAGSAPAIAPQTPENIWEMTFNGPPTE